MKSYFEHRLLTTLLGAATLLITSCENEDYAAMSCDTSQVSSNAVNCSTPVIETPPIKYEYKGGVTGRVFASEYLVDAQICFDINQNGRCDSASEPVEQTFEQGKFSFTEAAVSSSIAAKVSLLAVSKDKQLALYAATPASATNTEDNDVNVSVFTSLVVNESHYNPYHSGNTSSALNSLYQGDLKIANAEVLAGLDYVDTSNAVDASIIQQAALISASMIQGQALSPEKHYLATAAVVDEMYRSGSLSTTIDQAGIALQGSLSESISATLSAETTSWNLDHEEETNVAIDVVDDLAVIGSRFRNRLTIMDVTNDLPLFISSALFASSPARRDQVDAITGATEQVLTHVKITPDKSSAIVAVEKHKKEGGGRGVGIYRANLNDRMNIPFMLFGEFTSNNTNYYSEDRLQDIALSADGSRVVLASDNRSLVLLNTANFNLIQKTDLTGKARSVAIDETGRTAYVGLLNPKGFAIINTETSEQQAFIDTGHSFPDLIQSFSNNTRVAVRTYDSHQLSIYDTTQQASPALLKNIIASDKIKAFKISKDGKLALVALTQGRLELFSIENEARLVESLKTARDSNGFNRSIKSIQFSTDSRALVAIENAIQTLKIETRQVLEWTDAEKLEWYMTHRQ